MRNADYTDAELLAIAMEIWNVRVPEPHFRFLRPRLCRERTTFCPPPVCMGGLRIEIALQRLHNAAGDVVVIGYDSLHNILVAPTFLDPETGLTEEAQ